MKKMTMFLFAGAVICLTLTSCGPSAAEQEKAKQEILQIEASHQAVDSSKQEVTKTSQELDSLLNQLNAE